MLSSVTSDSMCIIHSIITWSRSGELQVWAVTVGGKVMVRQGVTSSCPEGAGWLRIPTSTGKEVSQVSHEL